MPRNGTGKQEPTASVKDLFWGTARGEISGEVLLKKKKKKGGEEKKYIQLLSWVAHAPVLALRLQEPL